MQTVVKWKPSLYILFILILLTTACSSNSTPEAEPSEPVVETPGPADELTEEPEAEPEPELAYVAPLTGIRSAEPVDERPLAVMINNAPAARPQSGLSQADHIYEVLAEGGITRLIAIFQSEGAGETLGPIRSIRPYLIELGESYGGILAHAGGSPAAYSILQNEGKPYLDEISNGGPYYFRSSDRKAPHNLYSSVDQLREGPFDVYYLNDSYTVSYEYDSAMQQYLRSVNGAEDLDANDGTRLAASNIVVLSTSHRVLDDVGRLALNLSSGGEAMLFKQGQLIRAEWKKSSGDIIRFYKDGKELPLVPGKSFFSIVPDSPALEEHITLH
ncbi:DUF3048 domain-containing protein [Paenibacillus urinalis]|uniref:DUF3048 domain-containing protein n=1 Tax=Paenibacillus urinalis TaxID=521520 RepID=UPI003625962F